MRHFIGEAPHNILILRALQLGDLLCTVPAFRALRSAFPNAQITLVGLPWAETFVQRFSHYLDNFIAFPGWPGLPERKAQVAQIPEFLENLQQQHFDLALQMQGSGVITNPIIHLFEARQTAGYYQPGQYRPTGPGFIPYPAGEHEIRIFLRLMKTLGIPDQGEYLEFPISKDEQHSFSAFRLAHGLTSDQYICLHPGARFEGRRWTPDKFARVGDRLHQLGYRVVVTGTKAESRLTTAVCQAMRAPALDLTGQTDLGALAMLLQNARLLISNDTGVSHVAAALQTPSVVLFTVSDPGRWRPLNQELHRVIVNATKASPEEVLMEAESILRKVPEHASQTI